MRINRPVHRDPVYTHAGGAGEVLTHEQTLTRMVLACMLWEPSFYKKDGTETANEIRQLVAKCKPAFVAQLAIEARHKHNMRHVSLLLVRELARHPQLHDGRTLTGLLPMTLTSVISRADELAEFLSIYWMDGKCPISHGVRKGLRNAFQKFNAYQFAKYDRDAAIKLRDVMFLCRPRPDTPEREALYKCIADRTLETPETWEVLLSSGADKRETFTRLISERKLGMLAMLRNLRNMVNAGVSTEVIREGLRTASGAERVLPFRYIAAAVACPMLENDIDACMLAQPVDPESILLGKTVLIVDVSGSMYQTMSQKSQMNLADAASALACILRERCADLDTYTFSDRVIGVPPRRGMALRDAIHQSQEHRNTYLATAINTVREAYHPLRNPVARTIVITDEQSHDGIALPMGKGYLLNVGAYSNAVRTAGQWERISGLSEASVSYIAALEKEGL